MSVAAIGEVDSAKRVPHPPLVIGLDTRQICRSDQRAQCRRMRPVAAVQTRRERSALHTAATLELSIATPSWLWQIVFVVGYRTDRPKDTVMIKRRFDWHLGGHPTAV